MSLQYIFETEHDYRKDSWQWLCFDFVKQYV